MDKTVAGLHEAIDPIHDGATVMIDGVGEAGSPMELLHALIDKRVRNLTLVKKNAGNGDVVKKLRRLI